jgi:hypothetical protein
MIKTCPGCGSELQYSDPNKVGYSPKKDAKLCERCFKLKNYNEKKIIDLKYNNDDIINLLNSNAKSIIFVTDFLNLSNKVIDIFKKINVKNKYLVINKIDYIPNSINKYKYISFIKNNYNVSENIILASAERNFNIRVINNILDDNKDMYICGFTNSGKSTIIKKLGELNNKDIPILTSLMPNTTLNVIKIKLNDNKYIYDTPGFINNYDFDENLYPKKFLKPVTLQVKENDLISINNQIFIKTDNENSFTFYMSNDVNIKKVYDKEIDLKNKVTIEENNDLVISNYGFINIKNPCNLLVNLDINDIEVRSSMF